MWFLILFEPDRSNKSTCPTINSAKKTFASIEAIIYRAHIQGTSVRHELSPTAL